MNGGISMIKERRDNKGRLLKTNEHQRADGRYVYRYKTAGGETRFMKKSIFKFMLLRIFAGIHSVLKW